MSTKTCITASIVADKDRMEMLPKHFGEHFNKVELAVFVSMDRLVPVYSGGFWDFYELSNGGFYMAAEISKGLVTVSVETNGYEGEMSAEAASIVACLFAYNQVLWDTRSEQLDDEYYKLRDFAGGHAEAAAIFAAID